MLPLRLHEFVYRLHMPPTRVEIYQYSVMGKKGKKSRKGVGELYDETKVDTLLTLTPTARGNLDQVAKDLKISRSEVVERFARGVLTLSESVVLSKEERAILGNS